MDKDLLKARMALQEVARREGVSLEEVVREIEVCIAEGMENCRRENNTAALDEWAAIPRAGEVPTPCELLAYLGGKLRK